MIVIARSLAVLGAALVAGTPIGGCGKESPPGDGGDATVATSEGRWERVRGPTPRARGFQNLVPVAAGDRVVVIAGVDYDQAVVKGLVLNPDTRRWSQTQPSGLWWRFGYSAVAAGDQVILWGGCCGGGGRGSQAPGAIYDLAGDRWSLLEEPGPLGNRYSHTAVWSGEEMIVWGGISPSGGDDRPEDLRADGAAYDPDSGTWRAIAPAPLSPRSAHVAVWTGEEMIVWGGSSLVRPLRSEQERLLYDGAAYDPGRDRWRALARARLPMAPTRIVWKGAEHQAAWTGEEMIVWTPYGGALYEPEADRWERISHPPAEIGRLRSGGSATWTGQQLIIWGGDTEIAVTEGAAYDPEAQRWTALPEAPISGRAGHAAVWTGEGVLIWGGCCGGVRYHTDGAIYVPG